MTDQADKKIHFPYFRAGLIFCLCTAIFLFIFSYQRKVYNELVNDILIEQVEERAQAIEAEISHSLSVITSIRSFYLASEFVSRKEFNVFTTPYFAELDSIQALEWIPKVSASQRAAYEKRARDEGLPGFQFTEKSSEGKMVPATEREIYFPVYYLNPIKGNENALGFDLNSNKERRRILSISRDTGETLATAPISLVQERGKSFGFIVFSPIYKKNINISGIEERRAAFEGFALGVYRINDLISAALKDFPVVGLNLNVTDITDKTKEHLLMTFIEGSMVEPEIEDSIKNTARSLSTVINILGREWKIDVSTTPAFARRLPNDHSRGFLIFGIVLTVLITWIYSMLVSKTSTLNALVVKRTEELNRSLEETASEKDKIDAIISSLGDGLLVTDNENKVLLMNKAAEELLDVQVFEAVGHSVNLAIKDDTLRDQVIDTLKKSSGYEFDFTLDSAGDVTTGKGRIMRAKTAVINDKFGNKSGIVTIIHDVSHEREVDRMKTEFISTAAHELRTPLTSIQGYSEILSTRDDLSKAEREKFLGYINHQSKGLAMIIDDLLNISRMENGKGLVLNRVRCDTGEAIQMICDQYDKISPNHDIACHLPKEIVHLFVDKDKMAQVLTNLLSNAVKYSPDGGTISMTGDIEGDEYVIAVKDNGIGMTPEQMAQVFNKFYRVNTSETAPEGTGLGMTIVKHIVEAHGGRIWLESEPGKGTKVIFTIPIKKKNIPYNPGEDIEMQ